MCLKWFPVHQNEYIDNDSFMNLTLEEQGLFFRMLMVMANQEDCLLLDDLKRVACRLQVSLRVWKRVRERLLNAGFLELKNGIIYNVSLLISKKNAETKLKHSSKGGKISQNLRQKLNKINDSTSSPLGSGLASELGTELEIEIEVEKEREIEEEEIKEKEKKTPLWGAKEKKKKIAADAAPPPEKPVSKKSSSSRGSRLPEDWTLPEDWRLWAAENCPDIDPVFEGEKFHDYWISATGQKATKANWLATWRNWCRSARPRSTSNVAQFPGSKPVRKEDDPFYSPTGDWRDAPAFKGGY